MNVSLNEAEIARLVAEKLTLSREFRNELAKVVSETVLATPEVRKEMQQSATSRLVSEVKDWTFQRVREQILQEAVKDVVRKIVTEEVGSVFRLVAGKMATKLAADAGMLFDEDKKENKFLVKDILNKPRD